ncbi:MAG TPA: D-aminoacyl-tRNA deacylase [Rhodospirillales bacterium]|jgi:D-tyrosyl-tRNA(Tyr) deacylase|nr:D-aminoacyl-tRNA deacylase [Rhodospirillales bacterium]HJO69773.1 D-aminoacyl-tRNA deacylase [Rhodospirillales bacterium]
MKALLQRVAKAGVSADGQPVAEIGPGLLVLLGVETGDNDDDADFLARKTAQLRIFEDADRRMNLSLLNVGGSALVVSQFTLAADVRRGNRPSFSAAAEPETAETLYGRYCAALETLGIAVQTGVFGATMAVHLVNEGPVTIMLDSQAR